MIDETIYIVTATGVCIDTEVKPFRNPQKAAKYVNDLKTSYGISEVMEMCTNCWKGYGSNVACDVEIQIHTEILRAA